MPSRRRSRTKNLGTNLADVQRRMRYLERRPVRTKLQAKVVKAANIAPASITSDEVSFPTVTVATGDPTEVNLNPVQGDINIDPISGSSSYYDSQEEDYVSLKAVDPVAQDAAEQATEAAADATDAAALAADAAARAEEAARLGKLAADAAQRSADGKNTIYRQAAEPTGATYAEGDTWFDTDGDNAIYRYSAATTSTVSNKSLTGNIARLTTSSAHEFEAGQSITVSGVDVTFNGTYVIATVPTNTTLTYAKTATNVPSAAASGTVTNTTGWKPITLGDNAITSISPTKISTGQLAAGVVYAGSLNANQISAGTIASNIIYSGTVNATQINAGTLAAGVIYAGTISADNINGGTITGVTINATSGGKIGAWDIGPTSDIGGGTYAAIKTADGDVVIGYNVDTGSQAVTGRPASVLSLTTPGGGLGFSVGAIGNSSITSSFILESTDGTIKSEGLDIDGMHPGLLTLSSDYITITGEIYGTTYDKVGPKNISATTATGVPDGGSDGDIVLVYV